MSVTRRSLFALSPFLVVAGCTSPAPVHVTNPESPCARLRASYPGHFGMDVFGDTSATSASIPWCFPSTVGPGILGYNLNVTVVREGTLTIGVSDVRPPTIFGATSIDANCAADATGKSYHGLGFGTGWSMHVVPGEYCISLIPKHPVSNDIWFTLTVQRP